MVFYIYSYIIIQNINICSGWLSFTLSKGTSPGTGNICSGDRTHCKRGIPNFRKHKSLKVAASKWAPSLFLGRDTDVIWSFKYVWEKVYAYKHTHPVWSKRHYLRRLLSTGALPLSVKVVLLLSEQLFSRHAEMGMTHRELARSNATHYAASYSNQSPTFLITTHSIHVYGTVS